MAHAAVEARWLLTVRGVLVTAEMLPGAVEVGVEDLAQRFALGRADAVGALIHHLRHVDEGGAEFLRGQEKVVSAIRLIVRRITRAEPLVGGTRIEGKFGAVLPEAALAGKDELAALGEVGVEPGLQLRIDPDVIWQEERLVAAEVHRSVDEPEEEMAFQQDTAGPFVGKRLPVGRAFGFA